MSSAHAAPRKNLLTRADLEHTPDDGLRYEIIDGELFVSPAPRYRHQRVAVLLGALLHETCPEGLIAMFAPLAVGLAEDTEVQPDILVAPRADFTEADLPGPPLLAVEILSPSTSHVDRGVKKKRYERAGVPSYWIVDPDGPTVHVYELDGDVYREAVVIRPDEEWLVERPLRMTIRPADLID